MDTQIKILVVNYYPLAIKVIAAVIASEPGLQIVGEATNSKNAVTMALELKPDIILMDLSLPNLDGIEPIRKIIKDDSKKRILIIVSQNDEKRVVQAIKAGVVGVIQDNSSPKEIIEAIQTIHHYGSWFPVDIARFLAMSIPESLVPKTTFGTLTEKEENIMRLVAKGLSDREIAENLGVSLATVRYHFNNLFRKLHFENRTQVALYAERNKII